MDELPFEPYAKYFDGGTDDLAAGFRQECAARVVHREGWEARAADELKTLGIRPDKPEVRRVAAATPANTSTSSARMTNTAATRSASNIDEPDMAVVRTLVTRFRGALIDDKRSSYGGRLWVDDPLQRGQLGMELKSLGFKWAAKRTAWYYPES